jgi:hypothetical protein
MAGGCFAYRAAEPGAVRPGQIVHLTLTPSGAQELTQHVGPRVESLDGRVIAARDSALAVSVTQLTRTRAGEEFWPGDSVVVPVHGVGSLRVRQLDRKRSALAVGGTIVAILVLRRTVQEAGLFGSGAKPPPGGQ